LYPGKHDEAQLEPSAHPAEEGQIPALLARVEELLRELRGRSSAAAEHGESLSRELESGRECLAARDSQLHGLEQRQAALRCDLEYWRTRAAEADRLLGVQAANEAALEAERRGLEEELARLHAEAQSHAAEHQALTARLAANAFEAVQFRRLASELERSLSWKITAPLRALTKPLFRAFASPAPAPAPQPAAKTVAPSPSPIDSIILPGLRRAGSIMVVACGVPFSSTLNQRPMMYARYFADKGATVLFIEVWQCPEQAVHAAGEEVYPRVFSLPLHALPGNPYAFQDNVDAIASASRAKSAYICTLPIPALVELVRPLRAAGYHIHYDLIDDWEEFHRDGEAAWFSAPMERELIVLADTVTAVSSKLAEKFGHLRSDIGVLRNGYQPAALACQQFAAARAPLDGPKIVGYFGYLSDAWFDWDAVFHAARKLPKIDFELIGYGISESSRARLAELPNIRFLGIVPQSELHRYAAKWWAGMIPFRPSGLSAAVDPLKIYEYLYFGLPTVVTGISGIADYPLVTFAGNHDSFAAAFEKLPDRPDEGSLSETAEFLKTCIWEERLTALDRMLGQPAGLPFLYAQ
jgi:glycosyltransferase involved in cell wall biosynthesis